ncbi:MAG: response regulator transcription factor, partial [Flavobacteriales bacterium]|nr:response regulator transcription factor [Flavobacteriales bacterium]
DGFEIAKYINENLQIPFIFLTSFADKDTLRKAKFLNPWGYIVKPCKAADLQAAIELIEVHENSQEDSEIAKKVDDALFYRDQNVLKKINISDISYVKAFGNYLEIYENDFKHLVRSTLQSLLSKLPNNFIRSHRSYIVNVNQIREVNSTYLLLDGINDELPIGKNCKDLITNILNIL